MQQLPPDPVCKARWLVGSWIAAPCYLDGMVKPAPLSDESSSVAILIADADSDLTFEESMIWVSEADACRMALWFVAHPETARA